METPLLSTFSARLTTGLLTGVAAGTATAGHIGAFRWTNTARRCQINALKAVWTTISGFTAAQAVGLDIVVARSYTASHTGVTAVAMGADVTGSGLTNGGSVFTRVGGQDVSVMPVVLIGATGALTAGTHNLNGYPEVIGYMSELADGAGVYKGTRVIERNYEGASLILSKNEGIVLRNLVLMGAGGTAYVTWSIDWSLI